MAIDVNNPCLFCNLPKNLLIQAENDLAFAVYDGFPVSPGHVLVIPKRHVANYFDLTSDELKAIQDLLGIMKKKLMKNFIRTDTTWELM